MSTELPDSLGRMQRTTCITEPALYKLAFRSRKPEAEAFTNWIASEVIPAIRKTGSYSATPTASPTALGLPDFTDPAAAAVAWAEQYSARKTLEERNVVMVEKVEHLEDDLKITEAVCDELADELKEAAPKVEAFEEFLDADGSINYGVPLNPSFVATAELPGRIQEYRQQIAGETGEVVDEEVVG